MSQLRQILNSIAANVVAVDLEGLIIDANPGAARLLGLSPEKLQRLPLADLVRTDENNPVVVELLAAVNRRGETVADVQLRAGENRFAATFSPLRNDGAEVIATLVTLFGSPAAEEKSSPTKRFLEEVLAQAPVGVAVFDGAEFRLRWTNDTYRQFLEEPYRDHDVTGVRFQDLVPQAEERGIMEIFRRVAATRCPFIGPEFEHVGFARGVTYWRWALIPLPDGQELPELMLVATEMTEQVRLRQRIDARRARLRTILDTLPVGVFIMDAGGRIEEANALTNKIWGGEAPLAENIEAYRQYRGWRPDTGEPLEPEEWPAARALLRGETTMGEIIDIERFDGSRGTIFVSAAPLRDEQGEITGAVTVIQDLTTQRQAEAALREQERLFRVIFDQAFQLMGLMAPDGTVLKINRAAADFLGTDPDRVLGRLFWETPWWSHSTKEQRKLRKAIEKAARGEFVRFETTHRRPDGELIEVDFSLKPVLNEKEEVVLVVPEGRDITASKKIGRELRQAKKAAEAASRAKSEFLANISHELRTPLTVIMGMTELALANPSSGEWRSYLEMAQSSSDSLLLLIDDIIEVSRMETGQSVIAVASFNLRECVENMLELLAADARRKGLKFSIEISPEIPGCIRGDCERIRQVLVNLVGNAVKFTEQGSITVRVHCRDDGCREILFAVFDTGIGIPAEKRDRLFRYFSQVDSSMTRRYGGAGLGLAISKGIIEGMGGRIWVESGSGTGSRFFFTLPRDACVAERRKKPADAGEAPAGGYGSDP